MHRRLLTESESGTAALEFALILPVLLMLYYGTVQLTDFLSVKHKLSSASAVMADLVTRHRDAIQVADLNDYLEAGNLVMAGSETGEMRARVLVYRVVSGHLRLAWSWQQHQQDPINHGCTNPVISELRPLFLGPAGTLPPSVSDVIVVVTCTRFSFPVPAILGFNMFPDTIAMRQQAVMRPRTYLQINCRDCPRS